MSLPPKAESVRTGGQPDGWFPPRGWQPQIAPDGSTRLVISVPSAELAATHLRLVRALSGPLGIRYVRLTDRQKGQLPAPESFVRMEVATDELVGWLEARRELMWHDGRHQTWIRGKFGEQVVLDELGMLFCYPDDVAFRDVLAGVPEVKLNGMDTRDYVKVTFLPEADEQEKTLLAEGRLVAWK
jgi:hypothetical protein